MDGEARIVDLGLVELLDGVAFGINGDQARRRDLVKQMAERVEQEAMILARQAHRQVSEDQVVHAEASEQAVGRREVTAQLPFLGIDIASVRHWPHHGSGEQMINQAALAEHSAALHALQRGTSAARV